MTEFHPAAPTKPLTIGAPLPYTLEQVFVQREDLIDELRRAECELVYAIARHRKAWQAMRIRAEERDEIANSGKVGMLPDLESDAIWKKRTGDVKWWAAEMTAQSTAVLALKALLDGRAAAKQSRDADRATGDKMTTTREVVLAWDPTRWPIPSETQYNLASTWVRASGGKPTVTPAEQARINELIRRYEQAHPEVFPPRS